VAIKAHTIKPNTVHKIHNRFSVKIKATQMLKRTTTPREVKIITLEFVLSENMRAPKEGALTGERRPDR